MDKRTKFIIWNYFENQHNQYAIYLICKKKYKTSENTSNLHDHLKRYHKELHNNNINNSSNESNTSTPEARVKN